MNKFFKFLIIFAIIISWVFSGYPPVWKNPRIPPKIQEAEALSVSQGDGLIIYGVSGNATPQWRTYTNSSDSFGAETGTVAGSAAGANFALRTSPTKQEAIAAYGTGGGVLQVMCYNGTNWSNEWSFTVGGTGTTRRFDIAYETATGDVLVVYASSTAATNAVKYRTKLGSAGCGSANWSSESNMPTTTSLTTGIVHWVKMAWDRRATSSLIMTIWADANSDLGGAVWNGSSFTNLRQFDTSLEVAAAAQDVDDFDTEFESLTGDIKVVWANSAGANGTNGVRDQDCTGGTSSCSWSASSTPATFADDATHLDLSANPASNEMIFTSIGNAGSDAQSGYWSGSAWTNTANVDTACETPGAGAHYTSSGWVTSGATTRGVLVYHDSNDTVVSYRHTATGAWTPAAGSAPLTFSPTPTFTQGTNVPRWYEIERDPFNTDRFMLVVNDNSSDLFAKRLVIDATPTFTWTNSDGGAALNATLTQNNARPWAFAYWRYIPAAPTISCSTNISSTGFGTLSSASITTASPNASTTMSCSNSSAGCTLYVKDQGSGSNPGLWNATSSYLIASASTTLAAGTEGYGLQATSTVTGSGATLSFNPTYNKIGNNVGGLLRTNVTLASTNATSSNREAVVTHKAAIAATTPAGTYNDTITYECTAN